MRKRCHYKNVERKRLFIDRKTSKKERVEIIKWAATNGYTAVVFSLGDKINENNECIKLAKRYDLIVEAGGWDLSLLVPRKLFLFHRDYFRMEQGKRKLHHHFCPTNNKTTEIITKRARFLFARSMQMMTIPRVFHILPDKGHETVWCSCPACRAFSPAEQNIISVNTAADVLALLDPDARLSFLDIDDEHITNGIPPRKNMFVLKDKP